MNSIPPEPADHDRITAAGWNYRSNERGWTIYRNPQTGCWHTRAEAIAIVDAEATESRARLNVVRAPS